VSNLDGISIIDVDTHVQEPPDLWTSRVPARLRDRVPQIRWSEQDQAEFWFMGDEKLIRPGLTATAGWDDYPTAGGPARFADIDTTFYKPRERLERMDADGIFAQILYPNLAAFNTQSFAADGDRDLHTLCIQVYNDFLTEWSSEDRARFLPVASIPFWDLDASLSELARAKEMGHRGIVFSQEPRAFGLPALTDPHWDPLWAAAQEMQLPVNFHIGTGDNSIFERLDTSFGRAAAVSSITTFGWLTNAYTISQLIFGGVCHRFPTLPFVVVESGVGWLPFAVDGMDWQFLGNGVHKEHPEYLLPSEYFERQIYGSFWFEGDTAREAIRRFPNNIMYETDYPHPTSMSPGPCSPAVSPRDYVQRELGVLSRDLLCNVLHDNAARVYGLDA